MVAYGKQGENPAKRTGRHLLASCSKASSSTSQKTVIAQENLTGEPDIMVLFTVLPNEKPEVEEMLGPLLPQELS